MSAYVIVEIDVQDPVGYEEYKKQAAATVHAHGGKYIVRGGKTEVLEGVARARNVVIEFASLQDAHDCYHSPEYTKAREYRDKAGQGEFILVEGV